MRRRTKPGRLPGRTGLTTRSELAALLLGAGLGHVSEVVRDAEVFGAGLPLAVLSNQRTDSATGGIDLCEVGGGEVLAFDPGVGDPPALLVDLPELTVQVIGKLAVGAEDDVDRLAVLTGPDKARVLDLVVDLAVGLALLELALRPLLLRAVLGLLLLDLPLTYL